MFGSDWMKEKGVTPPVREGASKVIGDTIGMISPMGLTKQGAKAMVDGVGKLKGLPVGMSIKDVSGPQSQALMLAQQRAALPVEQGGLGLAAGNTPAERAAAMGFDKNVLHGTSSDINKVVVLPEGRRYAQPFYTTADTSKDAAEFASQFANTKSEMGAPKVMPLMMRGSVMDTRNNPAALKKLQDVAEQSYTELKIGEKGLPTWGQVNNYATEAKNAGIDSILLDERAHLNSIANLNPENIRSRFAAFDPFRKTAATAALYGVAVPDLLASEEEPRARIGLRPDARGEGFSPGGAVQGYQAGGAVRAAKATAKSLGELVRKYTPETQLNEATQVAEEIKKLGLQFLPKIEQTNGGSVYLTVSKSPLTKQGVPSKNRNSTPIDFKARFADHPSYWGSTISSDPVTGNTPETIVKMFKHKIGSGDLPAYSEARFNPADKYGYITDVRREEGVSHKGNPVMKTIKDERPFTFYEPDARGEGFAAGGMVSAPDFAGDFDPARIDALVAELHALNAG
jgi:hypothetical protein